ncbi:MAG TPA: cupin domain-containing protein [Steroidobacteraceae bacterium]|nr:cupin domain-containing protein [Steroidobacteraceae bacterium]
MSRNPGDRPPSQDEVSNRIGDVPEGVDSRCFEDIAAAVAGSAMSPEARERVWTRIRARVASPEPEGTTTARADGAEWTALTPLVKLRRLRVDAEAGYQTVLVRAEPGGCIPRHRHTKDEEFIVLEGECYIGNHHLRAGDAHFASAGSWHEDITTKTGVLVLVRGEYKAPARA